MEEIKELTDVSIKELAYDLIVHGTDNCDLRLRIGDITVIMKLEITDVVDPYGASLLEEDAPNAGKDNV